MVSGSGHCLAVDQLLFGRYNRNLQSKLPFDYAAEAGQMPTFAYKSWLFTLGRIKSIGKHG
jgi:hypothetical protein